MSTPQTRVMICDDSAVMRRLLAQVIDSEPTLQTVAKVCNGKEAAEKFFDVRPDVLVMDIEMPVMDGVDAVREIRKRALDTPIIMFSSLTTQGAEATFDAMAAGATDFATKPARIGHIREAIQHVKENLITKIHHCTTPKYSQPASNWNTFASRENDTTPGDAPNALGRKDPPTPHAVAAVGIGVSTGGPQALSKLLSKLPTQLPMPVLVVQHMPPVFTALLAERLSAQNGHNVREAVDGEEVRSGEILIAPGDYHLTVVREQARVKVRLNQHDPENFCRPAADPLFRSLANCYGNRCLGLVLTGMGKDGANGAAALQERGASVYVQDEKSSVVWGMPGNVARCGLADRVLTLEQMATEVVRATGPISNLDLSHA